MFITSAEEIMYLLALICLFVVRQKLNRFPPDFDDKVKHEQ